MFPRLNRKKLSGWDLPYYMTKPLSGRKQKYTSGTSRGQGKVERSASIFPRSNGYKELFAIDWEPIEFGVEYFHDKRAVCQTSPEIFKHRIIFMSMFNDIDWTKNGNYNECFSNSEKVRTWVVSSSRRRKMVWNAPLQTWRTVEYYCRCHGCQFQRQRTSNNASFQCVGSGIRTVHRKSAQYLRSSRELVWWIDKQILVHSLLSMVKSVAEVNDHLCRKLEPQEVDTLEQTLRTNVPAARDRLRIHQERGWKVINWNKCFSDFWVCWIHEESLYWTVLTNHSRCRWCKWRYDRIMQRVYVTSWSSRFPKLWMCERFWVSVSVSNLWRPVIVGDVEQCDHGQETCTGPNR